MEIQSQQVYYIVYVVTKFASFEEARSTAPDAIAAHIARSKVLHEKGMLLLSGAFIEKSDEPLSTMAVLTSREAAQDYIQGDPFYLMNMIDLWHIREWANMFV